VIEGFCKGNQQKILYQGMIESFMIAIMVLHFNLWSD
jgi:hypothetical protein